MKRFVSLSACLLATLSVGGALAQTATTPAAPVAYVYVSTTTSSGPNQIRAFSAAPDGRLTQLKGSPFAASVAGMAVTGTYLFGADTNGSDIDSFSVAADGSLTKAAAINALTASGTECQAVGSLILDRTGATLLHMT